MAKAVAEAATTLLQVVVVAAAAAIVVVVRDDGNGALGFSCNRSINNNYLATQLQWREPTT